VVDSSGAGRSRRRLLFAGIALAASVGVLVFAGRALFELAYYTGYTLPGTSMEPTISPGSHLWARPVDSADIKAGDIVVLRPPASEGTTVRVVVRVVAVAGQSVAAHDGRLLVNGMPAAEPYLAPSTQTPPLTPITVPQHAVYVLGDNRQDSIGSDRYGPVPVQNVVDRVVRIGVASGAALLVRAAIALAVAILAGLVSWRMLRPRRLPRPSPEAAPERFFD
jgi:signal peptidase I